jgi:hypothetical protein
MQVALIIDVDSFDADEQNDRTGLSESAFTRLVAAIASEGFSIVHMWRRGSP